jgi:hypothetical protein
VRTELIHDPHAAMCIAKCQQILSQEPDSDWWAIIFRQIAGEESRQPLPAEVFAGRSAPIRLSQETVFLSNQHSSIATSKRQYMAGTAQSNSCDF